MGRVPHRKVADQVVREREVAEELAVADELALIAKVTDGDVVHDVAPTSVCPDTTAPDLALDLNNLDRKSVV